MKLQVLVATVGQTDLSLPEKMNLRQNAIIANQCGKQDYLFCQREDHSLQMLSTATKGVGINRNLALQLSEADILLFADDDITYYDSDLQAVAEAFEAIPDADAILFGLDISKKGEIIEKRRDPIKRLRLWNAMRYGACRLAVRREAIARGRLSFSTLFGGGCIYGCGEDTLFLRDCLRSGLRLYSHSYVLGACAKDSSTWFTGYDEKYFFDRGALLAAVYPRMKHFFKWRYIKKYSEKSKCSFGMVFKYVNLGIRAYGQGKSFAQMSGKAPKEAENVLGK